MALLKNRNLVPLTSAFCIDLVRVVLVASSRILVQIGLRKRIFQFMLLKVWYFRCSWVQGPFHQGFVHFPVLMSGRLSLSGGRNGQLSYPSSAPDLMSIVLAHIMCSSWAWGCCHRPRVRGEVLPKGNPSSWQAKQQEHPAGNLS